MTIATDNENFKLTYGEHNIAANQRISLGKEQYPEVFKNNAMEEIPFRVYFNDLDLDNERDVITPLKLSYKYVLSFVSVQQW